MVLRIEDILRKDFDPQSRVDDEIRFEGFRINIFKRIIYFALILCTLGFVWLLARWIPKLFILLNCSRTSLSKATRICEKGHYKELTNVKKEKHAFLVHNRSTKYFVWRYQVWRWHEDVMDLSYCSKYRPILYPYDRPISEISCGESEEARKTHYDQYAIKQYIYGENLIAIPISNVIVLLVDEVLNPFYLFQIFSVTVWMWEEYYSYSIAIIVISALGAITGVYQTRRNLKNLKKLAEYECEILLRTEAGSYKQTTSKELVPGDIVKVKDKLILPCDMVLIKGQAIMNESMLTGESIPVLKSQVPSNDNTPYNPDSSNHAKYTLYGGTEVLQVKKSKNNTEVLALVTQTGYSTSKGALVRSIIYPKVSKMRFYRDSLYFIGFLFFCGCVGFLGMTARFIQIGVPPSQIILKGLDLFTIIIAPALPIALTVGVIFAVNRLKNHQISCIVPSRVNAAGVVDVFCFDKTGTLTEDGLDVSGLRACVDGSFTNEENTVSHCSQLDLEKVLTSCHSLALLGDQLIGDSLEVKMFAATDWDLEEIIHDDDEHSIEERRRKEQQGIGTVGLIVRNKERTKEYGIMKQFDFTSDHQRMSTICKDMKTDQIFICSKGAPEVIVKISNPNSVPNNFFEVFNNYTSCGFRVLGCAIRRIDPHENYTNYSRDEVETGLDFVGLLIMENKLKKETAGTLTLLHQAKIESVMVTGDNPLTACYVAVTSNLLAPPSPSRPNNAIYLSELVENQGVIWRNVKYLTDENHRGKELNQLLLEYGSHVPSKVDPHASEKQSLLQKSEVNLSASFPPVNGKKEKLELVITGNCYDYLKKNNPLEFSIVLNHCKIYSRMKPSDKENLIQQISRNKPGKIIGMCGDGANDCGALKKSDIGLSLSEAESSIAAEFTSKLKNISSVIHLISEGRCALITSISAFKFMASYSMIQACTTLFLYAISAVLLSNWQFFWIDFFVVLPLTFSFELTHPPVITDHLPKERPVPFLLCSSVITSLLLQILVNSSFQALAYFLLFTQDWFVPTPPDVNAENSQCTEVTVLFLVANFQYIFSVISYSVGKPFRKPFYTNIYFVIVIIVELFVNLAILLMPGEEEYTISPVSVAIQNWLEMVDIPVSFRLILLAIVVVNSFLVILIEHWVLHFFCTTVDVCGEQSKPAKYVKKPKSKI